MRNVIIIIVSKISFLCVPEMRANVIRELACLDVEYLPHVDQFCEVERKGDRENRF